MNVRSLLNKTATATAFAGALTFASACAHHNSTADNDFGHVAQDTPATSVSNNGVTAIPGPAKVDSSGNVYTSSAAPGSGNSSAIGTNTNVNVIPAKTSSSVAYSADQSANLSTTTVDTTAVMTPPPAPPPPPAPMVTETTTTTTETTTTPMISSSTTTEEPVVTHKKMRKE